MNIIKLFLIASLLFGLNESYAQVGSLMKKANKALNKATNKLEEKAENEAEKEINKKIDKLFEKESKNEETVVEEEQEKKQVQEKKNENTSQQSKNDAQQTQAMLNLMGIGGQNINTPDEYNFDSNIKMELESYDSDNQSKEKVYYKTYFNSDGKSYAMKFTNDEQKQEDSEGFMIFDYENDAMIILNDEDGKKTGMVTKMNSEALTEDYEQERAEEDIENYPNFNKTGKTKKILGYTCEEYEYKDENGKSSYWFTDDVSIKNSSAIGSIESLSFLFAGKSFKGMLMEMESEDFTSKDKFHLIVTEINEKSSETIDISAYELISFGFQAPKQPTTEDDLQK